MYGLIKQRERNNELKLKESRVKKQNKNGGLKIMTRSKKKKRIEKQKKENDERGVEGNE